MLAVPDAERQDVFIGTMWASAQVQELAAEVQDQIEAAYPRLVDLGRGREFGAAEASRAWRGNA